MTTEMRARILHPNNICPLSGLTTEESTEAFACAAPWIILSQDIELVAGAFTAAVSTQAAPEACNDGFIRNDGSARHRLHSSIVVIEVKAGVDNK